MKPLEEQTFTDDFFDYGGETSHPGWVIRHDAELCRQLLEYREGKG